MGRLSLHFVCFVYLLVIAFAHVVKAQQSVMSSPPDERFKADILVIVAHPDDESLIAGYLAKAGPREQTSCRSFCNARRRRPEPCRI